MAQVSFVQEALYTYVEDIEDGVLSDVVLSDAALKLSFS